MKQAFFQGKSFDFPDDFADEDIAKALPGLYEQVKPTTADVVAAIPSLTVREYGAKPIQNAIRLGKDIVGADTTAQKDEVARLDAETRQQTGDFSLPQQMLLHGGSSALGAIPSALAGGVRAGVALAKGATGTAAALKGLGTATTIGATPTGLNSYGSNRDAGLGVPRSLGHAALDFAIEKYTEYLPGSKLLENAKGPFFKEMGKFLGRELTGEEIATVTQDLNAMVSSNPNMTLRDIANDMLVTAGATAIAGPLQGGAMKGIGMLLPDAPAAPAVPPAAPPAGGPLATTTPPAPAPSGAPQPAPSPASAISGLVRPAGAVVPPTPNAPAVDPLAAEINGQDAALAGVENGPMVKVYAIQLEGQTLPTEVLALPNDQAGASQLLAQAGGKGTILVAEMPQSQLDQLRASQVGNDDLKKQQFFGNEVLVPSTMFLGPSAVVPTVQAGQSAGAGVPAGTDVSSPSASPAGGVTAPISSTPAATPVTPLVANSKPGQRISIKLGKGPNKTVVFSTEKDKDHFSLMSKLRKLMSPKLTEMQKERISKEVQSLSRKFMNTMGETEYSTAMRVLGHWYAQVLDQVRANPEAKQVSIPELTPEIYQQLKEELAGKRKPAQTKSVEIDPKFKDDVHYQRMAKLLEKWIAVFSPGMKVKIRAEAGLTRSRGSMSAMPDGTFELTIPSRTRGQLTQLSVMAHEFGHMLFETALRNPKYAEQVQKLKEDWKMAMKEAETMSAEEYLKKYKGADTARDWKKVLDDSGLPHTASAAQYMQNLDNAHKKHFLENMGGMAEYNAWVARNGSYAINFHEFAADQTSRFVAKGGAKFFPADMQGFLQSIVDSMKTFYERVIKRLKITPSFEAWLKDLSEGKYLDMVSVKESITSGEYRDSLEDGLGDRFDYTTKVLNRLPGKERLLKQTIAGEANRQDVSKNERELILKVISEMPGDKVDAQEFKRKVLNSLIPLNTMSSKTYASYGKSGTDAFRRLFSYSDDLTFIQEWPHRTPVFINEHFPESGKYFSHARVWFRSEDAHVVELQSDWNLGEGQKKQLKEAEDFVKSRLREELSSWGSPEGQRAQQLNAPIEFYQWYQVAYEGGVNIPDEEDLPAGVDENSLYKLEMNYRDISKQKGILEGIRWLAGQRLTDPVNGRFFLGLVQAVKGSNEDLLPLTVEEMGVIAEGSDALDLRKELSGLLPKTWWHLTIRDLVRMMVNDNMGETLSRVHFPTGMTAAKVQGQVKGWYENGKIRWQDYGYPERSASISQSEWDKLTRAEKYSIFEQLAYENRGSNYPNVRNLTEDGNAYLVESSWTSLYKWYNQDVRQFLQKEYGAQLTTDQTGQTWMTFTLPDTKGLPIEYFEIYAAGSDAMDSIGPSLPPEMGGARNTFKGFLLNSLQVNQLAKVFPDVPGLQRFRRAMQDMFSMKNRLLAAPNERTVEWYGLGRPMGRLMEKMLMTEVESGVHLTRLKTIPTAAGNLMHVHEATPALEAAAKAAGVSEQGVKVYLGIKNDFSSMLDVMERMLQESVNRYFSKNPVLAQIRRLEVKAEFDRFREKPYFPDRGFGPWSVMVHAKRDMNINGRDFKQGELIYWRKFENETAQRKHKTKMAGAVPATDFNVSASYVEDLPYALRGLPANFAQLMVDELGLSPDQVAKLQQLRYDASKEGAFLRLLEKGKKGVGGGSTDLRRVYADYFWRTSNFVAKMFYSEEVNAALSDVHRQAMETRQAGGVSNLLDKLHERLAQKKDYVFNPQSEWEVMRMWVSLWYLWAVPKSALMNISSLPTVGYAYLGARFGEAKTVPAILKAMKDATMTIRDPAGAKLDADDHWALEKGLLDGTTDQSFAAELAAVTDANALERMVPWGEWATDSQFADSTRQVMWKSVWFGMLPFRAIEGVNRRTMLLAAFRLNLGKGLSREDAYQEAKDAVDYTQNDYSPWNKPKFLEGKKSVFLIFFSFVQNMAFFMYGGDKGWWRAMLVLAALGGLFALPGMENLIDMLNWAWKRISGEGTDLRVEAHRLAKGLGANPELVLHGALHAQGYLGWDTSGSVSLGRIIPGTDVVFGEGKFNDRFVQAAGEVGGPGGTLLINGMKAMMDDTSPSALARWEKVMPTVFRNLYRASGMWKNDAILDSQGRALVGDVTNSEIVGQALGFSSVRKAEKQELLGAQRDAAEYFRIRRENLLSRMWLAKQAGDVAGENAAEEAIDKYNEKVPDRKLAISTSDIRTSMKNRAKSVKEVEDGVPREKKYRALYDDIEGALRKE